MEAHPASSFDSRDCSVPGCPNEADPASTTGVCSPHSRSPLVSVKECKVEGCEQQANTRYDRGIYAGLCPDHIEERRGQASQSASAARRATGTPGRAEAEPSFEGRARTLVAIGRKLDRAVSSHNRRAAVIQDRERDLQQERARLRATLDEAMREWRSACRELAGEHA